MRLLVRMAVGVTAVAIVGAQYLGHRPASPVPAAVQAPAIPRPVAAAPQEAQAGPPPQASARRAQEAAQGAQTFRNRLQARQQD